MQMGPVSRMAFCAGALIAPWFTASAPANAQRVTYSEHVAPILFDHCVVCHRPGQAAPMSLMTYEEARPWAKSMQRQVVSRTMPPFAAAGPVGRYLDDPRLAEHQIETIERWAESGAMRGDLLAQPAPPDFPVDAWALGEPDIVVETPSIAIDPNSEEDYYYVFSSPVAAEDLWISAVELRSDRLDALHHANIFMARESEAELSNSIRNRFAVGGWKGRGAPVLAWLPGHTGRVMPEGTAWQLPANTAMVIDCHYATRNTDAPERLRIGLHLASGRIDRIEQAVGANMTRFLMPPQVASMVKTFDATFPLDALVRGFHVHMHYRGVYTKIVLTYPDGRSEPIFEIPTWDPAWQREYLLAEPLRVPKGTRATFTAEWNNSESNPNNPSPERYVRLGYGTQDEMYGATIYYLPEGGRGAGFDLADGLLVGGAPPRVEAERAAKD